MPLRPALLRRAFAFCGLALLATALQAAPPPPADALEPGDRIIVKLRDAAADEDGAKVDLTLRRLRVDTGVPMNRLHTITRGVHVLTLDHPRSAVELNTLLATLRRNPQVELAEPDRRVRAHNTTPNDPLYVNQWYLQNSNPSGIRANVAWDVTKGGTSPATSAVVIAVIDTGVRFDHPDLRRAASGGKLLPGYDFVGADSTGTYATANDGNGWDADPSDPGDWLSATDLANPPFKGKKCGGGTAQDQPTSSSWHGTRVAGLIAADTDNGAGIAGAAFHARILPVRALGKCGGFDSDVIAAMYWAAGLSIPSPLLSGAPPANPTPAQVLNLSLGGVGSCSALYLQAVRDITAHGVLIVASAGNEGGPVDEPANCPGVLGVGGLRHAGTKVGYSNLGPEVGISAPAGNCVNTTPGSPCLFTLDTTVDSGTQGPVGPTYTNQFNSNVGTSFSAPLAAAAAGLMRAVNPQLTPVQLIARIKSAAMPFPLLSDNTPQPPACRASTGTTDKQDFECICDTSVCGAGMLDMGAAVNAALRPAAVAGYSGTVGPNRTLTLDGSASGAAQGRTLSTFAWSVVATTGGAATPVFANASAASTTVVSPSLGSYTLRLTVTDNLGGTDTADITVDAASAGGTVTPSTPPATSGSSGGGALGVELLALAAWAACATRRRRAPSYGPGHQGA
jgi:serine protease